MNDWLIALALNSILAAAAFIKLLDLTQSQINKVKAAYLVLPIIFLSIGFWLIVCIIFLTSVKNLHSDQNALALIEKYLHHANYFILLGTLSCGLNIYIGKKITK